MLKYVGKGSFLPGIPARDLNDEEVSKYGGKRELIATGLYAEVERQRSIDNGRGQVINKSPNR